METKTFAVGRALFFSSHRVSQCRHFAREMRNGADDPLGGVEANGTLGGEGCAVASAAMVFKFYGIESDPQQLNWFLTSVGGIHRTRLALLGPRRVVRSRPGAARV